MTITELYEMTPLMIEMNVSHLISIHYFEFVKDYVFEGEAHDFWELVYVDKGEVHIYADQQKVILKKGEMIFHKPNEWHTVVANGVTAPNLIIVAFHSDSNGMRYFENKVITVDEEIRKHLTTIIAEGSEVYSNDLGDSNYKRLVRRDEVPFASEQIIKAHLELMLIEMIRKNKHRDKKVEIISSVKQTADEIKLEAIISYLREHLMMNLTIDDVCRANLISRSTLQKLFSKYMHLSAMEYFSKLRVDQAKIYIREGNYNFTQISNLMGYTSIHYFSRLFKKVTGMTITEYAVSVKARVEKI